jgi:hypothetical protein
VSVANCFSPLERAVLAIGKQGTVTWQPRQGGMDKFGNAIPAVSTLPFQGELVCVEVDSAGSPLPGNHLWGGRKQEGTCDAAATGIIGNLELFADDNRLCLGGGVSALCPNGAEYDSCPAGIDPTRLEGCWGQSRFGFVCG